MTVYTPAELAALRPVSLPEAAARSVLDYVCKVAPYIAGYAILTGNLPAYGAAAGTGVICALPLPPLPNPVLPLRRPYLGGARPIPYLFRAVRYWSTDDCVRQPTEVRTGLIIGPVSRLDTSAGLRPVACRPDPIELKGVELQQGEGLPNVGLGFIFPALGDYVSVTMTAVDGTPDPPNYPPLVPSPLPPWALPPIDYPDAPKLPGGEGNEPIYDPDDPSQEPRDWVPWKVLPVPLPIFVQPTLSVPINAPITIPVNIPVSISPEINGTINVQIGPSGEYRTGEDIICPCPEEGGDSPITCPPTSVIELPYYSCSPTPSFNVIDITAITSSVPTDLIDKLLSSANLAEIGCESISPEQRPASLLFEGRSGDITVSPQYTGTIPNEVVSVEVRLSDYSLEDYRELTTFPGGGQRKFGAIAYCLTDSEGGADQVYLWDESTYYRLPERLKALRLKIMLRPGISWEVWDTGERRR